MLKLKEGKHSSLSAPSQGDTWVAHRAPGCTLLTKVRMADCPSLSSFQEEGESETVEENVLWGMGWESV